MTACPGAIRSSPDRECGFALLDALVAIAITLGMAGLLFQVMTSTQGTRTRIELQRQAVMVAQSQLDRVGADIPASPGSSSGMEGDLAWRVDVSPFADGRPVAAGSPLRIVAVSVSVSVPDGQQPLLTLRTLRLTT